VNTNGGALMAHARVGDLFGTDSRSAAEPHRRLRSLSPTVVTVPPVNPMTLDEARGFVQRVLHS
jgi:hypothetical protein